MPNPDILKLINHIRIVPDEEALAQELALLSSAEKPTRVAFVNAHAFNMCYSNHAFLADLLACDRIYRDGSGMKILYTLLRREPGLNLNGTDLIPRIISSYSGRTIALLGTNSPYLEAAAEKIAANGLETSILLDGFQPDSVYSTAVSKEKPALVILAMGMPKQERVAHLIADANAYPCIIICGGAILDFLGGKVKRAPVLFRRLGIEWVYRLLQEPRRLFKRYIIGNTLFLLRAALLGLSTKLSR